jgi:protoheme IX farnesyltransferase
MQLLKLRLSWLVVFSALTSYFMGATNFTWVDPLWLTLGGFLVTGSSNAFNQIIERRLDLLMARTENRPMPKGRLSVAEALIFSSITGILGIAILWVCMNPLSGMLGIGALVSYVAIYTPLKRVTPFAVFVGAFPGAIPPLLGWVAATGEIGIQGLVLFAVQFIWQFPHFWALAWVLEDDYLKAGFHMLPAADGRSKTSALQILIYTAGLLPIGFLPFLFRMISPAALIITILAGIYFLRKALKLHQTLEVSDAKALMFASFIYLPVVQLAMMFDSLFVLPYWLNP